MDSVLDWAKAHCVVNHTGQAQLICVYRYYHHVYKPTMYIRILIKKDKMM